MSTVPPPRPPLTGVAPIGLSDSRLNAWVSIPVTIKPQTSVMGTGIVCNLFHFNNHRLLRLRVPVVVNQTAVIRWAYGNVELGTCQETLEGGNHLRYWIQNGPNANSGAIFMAVSYEMPIASTFLAILFRMLPLKSLDPP